MPGVLTLCEAGAGGSQVQTQAGQISNLLRPCLKVTKLKGLGMQLSVKALGSIPSAASKEVGRAQVSKFSAKLCFFSVV